MPREAAKCPPAEKPHLLYTIPRGMPIQGYITDEKFRKTLSPLIPQQHSQVQSVQQYLVLNIKQLKRYATDFSGS